MIIHNLYKCQDILTTLKTSECKFLILLIKNTSISTVFDLDSASIEPSIRKKAGFFKNWEFIPSERNPKSWGSLKEKWRRIFTPYLKIFSQWEPYQIILNEKKAVWKNINVLISLHFYLGEFSFNLVTWINIPVIYVVDTIRSRTFFVLAF